MHARRRAGRARRLARWTLGAAAVAAACVAYTWITLPDVRPLATRNPTTTAFMELRERERRAAGRKASMVQRWLPYSRISPALVRAVLVAEDAGFYDHDGIDWFEVKASFEKWRPGTTLRGASTITQQLAKNLYLSPSRNPYRKLTELLITRRLEAELTKTRILELYLNLIEWGDGVWGAEAAARQYFGRPASDLSASQAALLAGAIINPRIYSPARPGRRLLNRQQIILARMGRPREAVTGSIDSAAAPPVEPSVPTLPAETDRPDEPDVPEAPAEPAADPPVESR